MNTERWFIVVAGLSIVSCGESGPTMQHYVAEVGESVDAVQADLSSHHQSALGAQNMTALRSLERDHTLRVQQIMARMHDAQGSIGACAAMGMHSRVEQSTWAQDSSAFSDMMQSAEDEMSRHHDAMQAATSLDTARAEERAHRDTMRERMMQLSARRDTMMNEIDGWDHGEPMMCSTSSHMHGMW